MRRRSPFALLLPLILGLAACTNSEPTGCCDTCACDAGINPPFDLGAAVDAPAVVDRGTSPDVTAVTDAGNAVDATPPRDGPLPGLGGLSGACGNLRAMLHATAPSLVDNALAFTTGERYERALLSPGGQRLFDTPNAGGSSSESEVFSYEVLHRCEDATLVATETEVMYQPANDAGANSITDMLVSIGGERVGVSVTRAYRPMPMVVTEAVARDLLVTKLNGINRSSMRVLPAQRWVKQILHVFAVDMGAAQAVSRAWATIDAATRADTIVLVTTTRGGGFIYCNPDPALGSECPSL